MRPVHSSTQDCSERRFGHTVGQSSTCSAASKTSAQAQVASGTKGVLAAGATAPLFLPLTASTDRRYNQGVPVAATAACQLVLLLSTVVPNTHLEARGTLKAHCELDA
jgi:hypothetical protein